MFAGGSTEPTLFDFLSVGVGGSRYMSSQQLVKLLRQNYLQTDVKDKQNI